MYPEFRAMYYVERFQLYRRITSIVLITAMLFAGAACKYRQPVSQAPMAATETTYVCPMHPQIVRDKPGSCPICGMALVPASSGALMLTSIQEQLANIRVQKVAHASMSGGAIISARLAIDERQQTMVSSRTAGRVEKIFLRETGRSIAAGQPIYEIYSEQLIAQIQEYLILKDQYSRLGQQHSHYGNLLKGAEARLIRNGLTRKQIEGFSPSTSRVTFLSPAGGTISEVLFTEGQYIAEGTSLYRIDNLAKLWLEAELYPHEAGTFEVGDTLSVRVSGHDKPLSATVSFMTPVYRENVQVVIMRATLDNKAGKLFPGMQATVGRSTNKPNGVQVPLDAVIRDGRGSFVFVRTADHTFMIRMVRTGAENASTIEIIEGLTHTDDVVVSGAYLLYSELVLRQGADFMAHEH